MRRFLLVWMVLLCVAAPAAFAQDMDWAPVFAAVEAANPKGLEQEVAFDEAGDWLSVTLAQTGQLAGWIEGTQWSGMVFAMPEMTPVTWDDVFTDGDAAAARIEEIAGADGEANAYAEYTEISPVPRDSFTVVDGVMTVYYPVDQLSYFSGRSGAYSFYAYELDGLLAEGVPLTVGDMAQAKDTLAEVLETGALPGPLKAWTIGLPVADAEDVLGLVDTPDLKDNVAVWQYEAPQMRGISLLSAVDAERTVGDTISGILAKRMDFSGLCTGIATQEDCIAALGTPDYTDTVDTADAYSLLPVGETLTWEGETHTFSMHFAENTLHAILLMAK